MINDMGNFKKDIQKDYFVIDLLIHYGILIVN